MSGRRTRQRAFDEEEESGARGGGGGGGGSGAAGGGGGGGGGGAPSAGGGGGPSGEGSGAGGISPLSLILDPQRRRVTCHICGNLRSSMQSCEQCPMVFCAKCIEKTGPLSPAGCSFCLGTCCCSGLG